MVRKGSGVHQKEVSVLLRDDSAFEGVAVFEGTEGLLMMNPRMELILGRTAREVASLDRLTRIVFPAEQDAGARVGQILAIGASGTDTFRIETSDGTTRWCRCHVSRSDDGGVIVRMLDDTALRKREAARLATERRCSLFEESKDAISVSREDELIVNQAWLDLFGYTREEAASLDVTTIYANPDERRHYLRELEKSGFVRDYGMKLLRKDGTRIDCVSTAIVHRNGDGKLQYESIIRDVTEHKAALAALQESERKYRYLVENINEIIYSIDAKGTITYISPVVERITGYRPAEMSGKILPDVRYVYPTDLPKVREVFSRAFEGESGVHLFRFLSKSGDIIWFNASIYPERKDGVITGLHGILSDITAAIESENVLRESRERLSAFLDSATESFFLFDSSLRLVEINRTAREEFSLSAEQILGKSLPYFLKTIAFPVNPGVFVEVLNTGEPCFVKDIPFCAFFMDFRVFRVGNGLGVIATNITERKHSESMLRNTQTYLERRVKERTADLHTMNRNLEREITDRRRTQKTLARRESELTAILNNFADFAWLKDHESRYILVNRAFAEMHGKAADFFTGLNDYAIWSKKLAELYHAGDRMVIDAGKTMKFEEPLEFPVRKIIVETIKSPIRDESGRVVGTVGISRDITDRKQFENELQRARDDLEARVMERTAVLARTNRDLEWEIQERLTIETALRESEERYRTLFETSMDAIVVTDPSLCYLDMNQAWIGLFGYTSEEMAGRDFETIFADHTDSRGFRTVVLEKGYVRDYETCFRRKDGNVLDCLVTMTPWQNSAGVKIGFQALIRDISEQKKAERMLRFQSKFQSLVSGISTSFINAPIDEIDAGITRALKAFGTFSGVDRGYVCLLRDPDTLIVTHEWHRDGVPSRKDATSEITVDSLPWVFGQLSNFGIVFASWVSELPAEAAADRTSAELWGVESFIAVPMVHKGKLIGMFGFESLSKGAEWGDESQTLLRLVGEMLVNALERQKVGWKISEYQEKLRSVASELTLAEERERRRIAVDLHDRIGQTLAVSKITLGTVRERLNGSCLGDQIDEVTKLVGDAINDTRSLIFEISPPVLYDLGIEAALEWLGEQIERQHGVETEFFDDGTIKDLDVNMSVMLFQFARELMVNAAKHARASRITISIRRAGSMVEVEVQDDGIGFDVESNVTRTSEKTGYGLFSIRERLGHLGGHFRIESVPGRGTRVAMSVSVKCAEKGEKEG